MFQPAWLAGRRISTRPVSISDSAKPSNLTEFFVNVFYRVYSI